MNMKRLNGSGTDGYSLVEAMMVVAGIGIVTAFAAPSISRFKASHEVHAATWEVGGVLKQTRSRAVQHATPYLVLFQKEEVTAAGSRSAFALIVRDNDRSYSVTPPDEVESFSLSSDVGTRVRQYGETEIVPYPDMPPVEYDLLPVFRATGSTNPAGSTSPVSPTAPTSVSIASAPSSGKPKKVKSIKGKGKGLSGSGGLLGGVTDLVGGLLGIGSGSGSSGSGSSSGTGSSGAGSPLATVRATTSSGSVDDPAVHETVEEIVMNGASFPLSEGEGVPALAFDERGVPVSLDSPTEWGSGAGAIYLTDNERVVYAAALSPMGEVQVERYDPLTTSWK